LVLMPKATVDKGHALLCAKDNIGIAWQIGRMKAVPIREGVKQPPNYQFRAAGALLISPHHRANSSGACRR
jgi:hypothetical protein